MLLLWRHLIAQYLKVTALTIGACISILLVIKLEEMAKLASYGAPVLTLLQLSLLDIPHLIPLICPIACLLASYLQMRSLSLSYELIALRASGLSFKQILMPLVVAGSFLSIFNFYAISEMATKAHLHSKQMVMQLSTSNPLSLIYNNKVLRQNQAWAEAGRKKGQLGAEDVIIVSLPKGQKRLCLFQAKELSVDKNQFKAYKASIISPLSSISTTPGTFAPLLIENQQSMLSSTQDFAFLVPHHCSQLSCDHLCFAHLLTRWRLGLSSLSEPFSLTSKKETIRCLNEFMRRFCMGLSVLPFTLFGAVYGVQIGRTRGRHLIVTVIGVCSLCLSCFVIAKEAGRGYLFISLLYLLPLLLPLTLSLKRINRLNKGLE